MSVRAGSSFALALAESTARSMAEPPPGTVRRVFPRRRDNIASVANCTRLLLRGAEVRFGECSFIGQRHYTGFSGEILGRYGHDTGAYPRENCIGPLRPLKPSPRCACGRGRVYGGCLFPQPATHVRGDHNYTDVRAGRRKQRSSGCGCLTSARECRSSMCVLCG